MSCLVSSRLSHSRSLAFCLPGLPVPCLHSKLQVPCTPTSRSLSPPLLHCARAREPRSSWSGFRDRQEDSLVYSHLPWSRSHRVLLLLRVPTLNSPFPLPSSVIAYPLSPALASLAPLSSLPRLRPLPPQIPNSVVRAPTHRPTATPSPSASPLSVVHYPLSAVPHRYRLPGLPSLSKLPPSQPPRLPIPFPFLAFRGRARYPAVAVSPCTCTCTRTPRRYR